MNKYGWIIFSVVVVVLLGGLVAWTRISNPPIDLSGVENNSIIAASEQNGNIGDHSKGSEDKKIILIEYGDYQCPGCEGAYPYVNQIMDEYGDHVTFIFRNFPLTAIHPNAKAAAAVAEAAGLQGKFWEMHDILYENQEDWNNLDTNQRTTVFTGYANQLGLNIDTFNADIAGANVTRKINFDLALGKSVKTSATPTFFLNGEKLDENTADGIVKGNLTLVKEKLDQLIKE